MLFAAVSNADTGNINGMKKNILPLLLIGLFIFSSCEKEVNNYNLAIDLQFSFKHDQVKVFIDGLPRFDRNVTTNQSLGYSGSTTTTLNSGVHQLKVVINDTIHKTVIFPLNANLFIGIKYEESTGEISVDYSHQPFAYK